MEIVRAALASPGAETVTVAMPLLVAVKLAYATPFSVVSVDFGVKEPLAPATESARVNLPAETVLPAAFCTVTTNAIGSPVCDEADWEVKDNMAAAFFPCNVFAAGASLSVDSSAATSKGLVSVKQRVNSRRLRNLGSRLGSKASMVVLLLLFIVLDC